MAGSSSSSIRPRVLLTRRIPSSAFEKLEARCDVDINDQGSLSPDELKRRLADKDGLICVVTDKIARDVLDAGAKLKVVANIAVGYDNIDVPAARSRGIVVTNTPDVLTEAVAEITWGLIFSITRRIVEGDRLVRRGAWKGWALDFMALLATRAGVEGGPLRILAPLLQLSKADIIRRGTALGLDYGLTHSCYDPRPDGAPCDRCDSCRLRARGFAEAGVEDPLLRGRAR